MRPLCFRLFRTYRGSLFFARVLDVRTRALMELLPNSTRMMSPTLTSVPALATLSLTKTRPWSQASLATVRLFISREFLRNLSILIRLLNPTYLVTASLRALPALKTGALAAAILITSSGFSDFCPVLLSLSGLKSTEADQLYLLALYQASSLLRAAR